MKKLYLLIMAFILSSVSVNAFMENVRDSHALFSEFTISQSQGGSLELGMDQIVFDNSTADTVCPYQDTIQLVHYEGRPLTGLTFDLISHGKITVTHLTFDIAFSPDHWTISTTTHRGHILADGSSIDTIRVVMFSTGFDAIHPTAKTVIATFGYHTVNIDTVSDTTSIQLQNIHGAAVDTLGWPIEAGLNSNDYQRITINNLTTISISICKAWNLVSVPVVPSMYDANTLFPGKTGTMFAYHASTKDYAAASTLSNGEGYWINYTSARNIILTGRAVSGTTVTVMQAGWILLGSMSSPVDISTLVTIPANAITGVVWRFNSITNTYVATTIINPGEAVWAIVDRACTITYP